MSDDPEEFEIRETPDRLPGVLFGRADAAKEHKNRLNLDLRPDDQHVEVERLLGLGAALVDIGPGDVP